MPGGHQTTLLQIFQPPKIIPMFHHVSISRGFNLTFIFSKMRVVESPSLQVDGRKHDYPMNLDGFGMIWGILVSHHLWTNAQVYPKPEGLRGDTSP